MEDALYTSRVQQICRVVYFGGLTAAGLGRKRCKFRNTECVFLAVVTLCAGRFLAICNFCSVQANFFRLTRAKNEDSRPTL